MFLELNALQTLRVLSKSENVFVNVGEIPWTHPVGIEPTSSDNRSAILPIELSNFLSIFSSSRKREEDHSIAQLLLAQVQFPKQSKVILSLGICLSNDTFSCASEYSSRLWSITLSQYAYGTVRLPRNLDSAFFQRLLLDSFLSFLVNFLFILSLGRCFANWWIARHNGTLFGKLKWIILLLMI